MEHDHVAKVAELTAALLPSLEEMLVHAWRRLAAAIQRSVDSAGAEDTAEAGLLRRLRGSGGFHPPDSTVARRSAGRSGDDLRGRLLGRRGGTGRD